MIRPIGRALHSARRAIALGLLLGLPLAQDASPAFAQDCGQALNALVRRNLQSALDRSNLCGDLSAQVGGLGAGMARTTRAQVTAFNLCLSREAIDFTGRLEVTCKATDKAPVKGSISETFDLSGRVRTSDCGVSALRVEPVGELGKLAAALYGLDVRARSALDASLKSLCR